MPNALQKKIEAAAADFARAVLAAIRHASLDDILQETRESGDEASAVKRRPGRPKKMSMPGATTRADLIIAYVKKHPGTSGQDARKALGFPRDQWAVYLGRAVAAGTLRKEGLRRATRYWTT